MSVPKKLWCLLTTDQRRDAVVLLVFMLFGVALETLGIGLIIPALALMTQGDIGSKNPILPLWLQHFGTLSQTQLLIGGLLTLVGVYSVKALFLGYLAWQQAGFVFGLRSNLSQRLFAGYLRQPYTFHLQNNSAQLIRNVINHVADITNVIQKGLMLITETMVMLCIAALLVAVEPLGALLVVSTLGLAGWGFNRLTRSRVLLWGQALQHHDGLRIQHLQQGLGGAKDVKLLGREADFLAQYWIHNDGSASVGKRQDALGALPRLWLELLAVTGLVILVFGMIWQGKPLEALLPTLGLFAAAAFRLMPSSNRVISAVQSVHYALPVIDTLYNEFRQFNASPPTADSRPLPFKSALTLSRVSFNYPSTEAQALRDVSLTIPHGSSIGFIGGSGAGKSTLVDIILGLLPPTAGTIMVDGIDIQSNLRGWQDQIGYVPQSIFLTDDTLRRNVAFGLPNDQIDEAAVWRAIRAAQLEQFVKDLPQGLETLVGERGIRLSGGQRQRIGIARALYHDPSVLVLDEATSSLDSTTESGVMEAVRALQGKKTLIIVAHRLSTVEHCNRLYRLEQGKLIEEGDAAVILRRLSATLPEANDG